MRTIYYFLLLFVLIPFACEKDENITPSQTFQASLFVTLKDPKGIPVQGAQISLGNNFGLTDENGNYFFTDIDLTGDDLLVAEKAGYFQGSRRFRSEGPQTKFVRITLLPQVEEGSFSSTQPATISIDNKSKLHFPANAIVHENGSAYSGNVHVLANPIYGDDEQLSNKMPGNLIGLNASGTQMALGSFGMIAVELRSDNGEKLQVADNQFVQMEFAIADNQLDKAPLSIPLWSYDEEQGYWVEEGVAIKQGDVYVAPLTHFSYWNCDEPLTMTEWTGTVVYLDGDPAQNVSVCLNIESLNSKRCAQTDAKGRVSGFIPSDEPLEVSIENECGSQLLVFDAASVGELAAMNPIRLTEASEVGVSTIEGIALQCDGMPITSGYALVLTGSNVFVFPIEGAEGRYKGSFEHCAGDLISLQFVDVANSFESAVYTYSTDRNMNMGSLNACIDAKEFIRFQIKGFGASYNYYEHEVSMTNHTTKISTLDSIGENGKLEFTFDGTTPGIYRAYLTLGNQVNLPNGQVGYFIRMDLDVTEFGGPHQMIRGTFTGKLNVGGNGAGGSGDSDVTGSFAVRNN